MSKKTLLRGVILLLLSVCLYAEEVKGKGVSGSENKAVLDGVKKENPQDKAHNKELPSLIVFDISPEKGVEKGAANLLTEMILSEVAKLNRYKVIGQVDIDRMLFWESNKQLKNCTEDSCMMQIAGAMGAEYYIVGSVGMMGDNYILNLRIIDSIKAEVIERITEMIKRNENELIKGVKVAVKETCQQVGGLYGFIPGTKGKMFSDVNGLV